MGFNEALVLLLSLSGFGVEPNPQAPPAAEVLKYAPADADYFFYFDAQAMVPGNYKLLTGLRDRPGIKADAELRKVVDAVNNEVEAVRTAAQGMLGIDPVKDVKSLAAWVKVPDAGDPTFLVVVRGTFPRDLVDRIGAALGSSPELIDGKPLLRSPDGEAAIAMATDGALIAGSPDWVKPRMAARWAPGPRKGLAAGVAPMLNGKPFLAIASAPSASAVRVIERELGRDPEAAVLVDLLVGHTFAAAALAHNGVSWTVTARAAAGFERAALASDGLIALMRSVHQGSRGFARLVMAVLPSYAGASPEIAEALKHRDELLQLVDASTGDGNFKAEVEKAARTRTVTVRAYSKELREVLPAAGLMPLVGAGAWLALVGRKEEVAMPPTSAPARATAPRSPPKAVAPKVAPGNKK